MKMSEIRDIVFNNLNNVNANGHFEQDGYFNGWSAEDIAQDMVDQDAETTNCENFTKEQILPFIEEWLNLRNTISKILP
jgi:hypothetical protein